MFVVLKHQSNLWAQQLKRETNLNLKQIGLFRISYRPDCYYEKTR